MIAYYFPPAGSVGVYRTIKFAKYLPEFGWTPIVLSDAVITSGEITIRFGFVRGPSVSLGTAIHLDRLVLTPEPAGTLLFALAALPLLGRRRT